MYTLIGTIAGLIWIIGRIAAMTIPEPERDLTAEELDELRNRPLAFPDGEREEVRRAIRRQLERPPRQPEHGDYYAVITVYPINGRPERIDVVTTDPRTSPFSPWVQGDYVFVGHYQSDVSAEQAAQNYWNENTERDDDGFVQWK